MPVTAVVRLELGPQDDRHYRLPGAGTLSLIFVFGAEERVGARAVSSDGRDLTPGSVHESLRQDFWDPIADEIVRAGRTFEVWYGGTVGRGVVGSITHDVP